VLASIFRSRSRFCFRVSSISLDAVLDAHARVAAIDLPIVAKTRRRAICQRFARDRQLFDDDRESSRSGQVVAPEN